MISLVHTLPQPPAPAIDDWVFIDRIGNDILEGDIKTNFLERASEKFKTMADWKSWVNEMPKGAELHLHLMGSVYAEELLEIAIKYNLGFDPSTNLFVKLSANDREGVIPAKDLSSQPQYYTQYLERVTMNNVEKSSKDPHYHFMYECFITIDSIYSCLQTAKEIADLVDIVRKNAQRQHVRWTELMVLLPALELLKETFSKEDDSVGYIVELLRSTPIDQFQTQIERAITLIQQYPGKILSFNIVGPEDDPIAQANFEEQMAYIQKRFQETGIQSTLHAGELVRKFTIPEIMSDRLKRVSEVGVRRLGHGLCLFESNDYLNLCKELKNRKIAIEICLTSNDKILGVKSNEHPIKAYDESGVAITINSDDPGVNREALNDQFYRLVEDYQYELSKLVQFTRNGLEYSFLSGESIFENGDTTRFKPLFLGIDSENWEPTAEVTAFLSNSRRAREQVAHERELVDFLKRLVNA